MRVLRAFTTLVALYSFFAQPSRVAAQPVELVSFDIVELRGRGAHEGFFPIYGDPILGAPASALATLAGPFQTAAFRLFSVDGRVLRNIDLAPTGPPGVNNGIVDFFGTFDLPNEAFKLIVSGIGKDGFPFEVTQSSKTWVPQTVGLRFDRTFYSLPAGTSPVLFSVTNYGFAGEFNIEAKDDRGLITGTRNFQESIGANQTKFFIIFLSVPDTMPEGTFVNLTATARSAISATGINTAAISFPVEIIGNISLTVDIRPGSCDNPLNSKSLGVVPVAILGTERFDVRKLNPSSLKLANSGFPVHFSFEDIGAPGPENCARTKKDGKTDLLLEFTNQNLTDFIKSYPNGTRLILPIAGETIDGAAISGEDIVVVVH